MRLLDFRGPTGAHGRRHSSGAGQQGARSYQAPAPGVWRVDAFLAGSALALR